MAVLVAVGGVGYRSLSPAAIAQDPPPARYQLPAAAPDVNAPATQALLNQYAAIGIARLSATYNAGSNRATRSWRAANALGALIQYMQVSGSLAYVGDIGATYMAHATDAHPFINRFYDDEGWWALTWIRAYDLTGDPRYLKLAESIFRNLTKGWTPACGGGVRWSKFAPYKDAISNELFLEISAELHNRVPGDHRYRRWALREWKWLRASGMITPSGLVVDGLDPATCQPNLESTTWTYNQGVLLGGLVNLESITHRKHLLAIAEEVAATVIRSPLLSPAGILQEPPCGLAPTCGNDAPTFKGIFAQNLRLLYDRVHVPGYETYLLRNAISVWVHDRRGNQFGMYWGGPFDSTDIARQVAAVDLFNTQVTGPGAAVAGRVPPAPAASPVPSP